MRREVMRRAPEACLLVAGYAGYSVIRDLVPGGSSVAVTRGWGLLHTERLVHLDPEHGLNRFIAGHPMLAQVADYYYATGHFLITIAVLAAVYWLAPGRARRYAAAWYGMNLLGLAGFWCYPLAPPRLLSHAGFVDTVVRFGTWGGWGAHSVASVSNQYAAMPSLHTGWEVWCAITVWALSRRCWVRALAVAYPVLTVVVVLGTANHYLADTVAGALTAAAGFALLTVPAAARAVIRSAGAGIPAPAYALPAPADEGTGR